MRPRKRFPLSIISDLWSHLDLVYIWFSSHGCRVQLGPLTCPAAKYLVSSTTWKNVCFQTCSERLPRVLNVSGALLKRRWGNKTSTHINSQRLASQHQEKTLLLRGAAFASLFTSHRYMCRFTTACKHFTLVLSFDKPTLPPSSSSPLLLAVFGFPTLKAEKQSFLNTPPIYFVPWIQGVSALKIKQFSFYLSGQDFGRYKNSSFNKTCTL